MLFGQFQFLTFGTVFERISAGFRRLRRLLVASGWVPWFVGVFGSSFVVLFVVFSFLVFAVSAVEPVLSKGF